MMLMVPEWSWRMVWFWIPLISYYQFVCKVSIFYLFPVLYGKLTATGPILPKAIKLFDNLDKLDSHKKTYY